MNNANPLVIAIMKAKYYVDDEFLNANLGINPNQDSSEISATRISSRKDGFLFRREGNPISVTHNRVHLIV